MVPCYRSAFGLPDLLKAMMSWSGPVKVEEVEVAYAEALGMPYAILLPSARAGIFWTLRVCGCSEQQVLCPVFTCWEVWHAVRRARAHLSLIDLGEGSFLMDYKVLATFQRSPHAMVLSQVYGYHYNLTALDQQSTCDPLVRIVDMAMELPDPKLFSQLGSKDVALISFGTRKCLYSGWGGMALMRDRSLAAELRRLRDLEQEPECFTKAWLSLTRMFITELARLNVAYSMVHASRRWRSKFQKETPIDAILPDCFEKGQDHAGFDAYYRVPSSGLNRYLMLCNLSKIEDQRKHRRRLADHYAKNLGGMTGIILPPISPTAMSHYTIRVEAERRSEIVDSLVQSGITVETLFPFSARLPASEYPVSANVARQVINLPLHSKVSLSDVDHICAVLRKAVE